ncbi:hypothetical protein A3I40_03680 [Candidatus Uhrbacteria bacterium RIFCSPLOWO2_02_FULL_48_12]|uniref:Uncharacterized protein n=1 Tax=Candidatus Uhrbacteria bacterium RIFCSPLOWO2_02_FULL_48_12 TaxID=1802407 RepID=A0A1F7VA00_9BACT|nr:MAG: hypothetical protein A3I40_03680 [Candidatus Uhrbacteria bacterium RIFCSPLOWO2_02_FULL_48_12]
MRKRQLWPKRTKYRRRQRLSVTELECLMTDYERQLRGCERNGRVRSRGCRELRQKLADVRAEIEERRRSELSGGT